MHRYILAIDQGTTSSRAVLVDESMQIAGVAQQEFTQYFPQPGWVEHDPEEIWNSVVKTINAVLAQSKAQAAEIVGIGITNQRETTIVWDRTTGAPIHRAIMWQCRRTTPLCESLKAAGHASSVREKTGLVLDPYFSGTKITWILENVEGARAKAADGSLVFGTIDSFLTWRLTGGVAHVTDVSNASRTLLMNIATCEWDESLRTLFHVPGSMLPRIVSSSEVVGYTRGVAGLPDGIPIAGLAGDQQSALFGQACFAPGQAKCTYGTGSFLLMNTGDRPIHSTRGLLTTVGWRRNGTTIYALEGSSFIAGAVVQWLRDGLGLIEQASDIETLARTVDSSDGVVFVPAFAGLGAPHWRPEARGLLTGLTRGTTAAHLARAALDGIALQQCDVLTTMTEDSGIPLTELRVDGGAATNNLLMQIQADLLGLTVIRPRHTETTVMGAAFLAGLAIGLWESETAIAQYWQEDRRFTSDITADQRAVTRQRWQTALHKA